MQFYDSSNGKFLTSLLRDAHTIQITGIDTVSKFTLIKENSHNDPGRSRLKELDLLLINGGVGSIGSSCVLVK